jgi:exopolysaccharide production protein ExoQ
MPPLLALFVGLALALGMFWRDRERRKDLSLAICVPLLWYLTAATRPLGIWLSIWGVPIGGGGSGEDGIFVDRYYYLVLTLVGLGILARRNFKWGETLARSPWLLCALAFMALSIVWSNFPYISFKRFVKVIGSATMALVILTEKSPSASLLALLRYTLYLHVPLSIICNKYFRGISVQFSWDGGSQMWQGLATSKNTPGQVAMLAFVYFLWEVWREWRSKGWRNPHLAYLLMAVWLLKGSENGVSMTSVIVCIFASVTFLQLQRLHRRGASVVPFGRLVFAATIGLATLVYLHGIFLFDEDSLFGKMITTFGRNITLTDRTHIWNGMYEAARGSFFGGVGFGGFWIGREANIGWNATMTWVLGQGHNGYVDTFLQTGSIGLILMLGVILSTFRRLLHSSGNNFDYFAFRLTLLLTIIFINITETTFLRGDHHLWFLFMVVCWSVALPEPESTGAGSSLAEGDPADSGLSYAAEEAADPSDPRGELPAVR